MTDGSRKLTLVSYLHVPIDGAGLDGNHMHHLTHPAEAADAIAHLLQDAFATTPPASSRRRNGYWRRSATTGNSTTGAPRPAGDPRPVRCHASAGSFPGPKESSHVPAMNNDQDEAERSRYEVAIRGGSDHHKDWREKVGGSRNREVPLVAVSLRALQGRAVHEWDLTQQPRPSQCRHYRVG